MRRERDELEEQAARRHKRELQAAQESITRDVEARKDKERAADIARAVEARDREQRSAAARRGARPRSRSVKF